MNDIDFFKWMWGDKWYLYTNEIYNWNSMMKHKPLK